MPGIVVELPDEDRAHDEGVQRALDDEMEAKRAASGYSPEQLSLQDAFIAGQQAGLRGNGANLNPYDHGTPEHAEWERARSGAQGAMLNGPISRARIA